MGKKPKKNTQKINKAEEVNFTISSSLNDILKLQTFGQKFDLDIRTLDEKQIIKILHYYSVRN